MKKGQIKKRRCPCGKFMKPVKDSIQKTYTGYLWRCSCMPKNAVLSIG